MKFPKSGTKPQLLENEGVTPMVPAAYTSKQILSDVITNLKYARYLPSQQRREVWSEVCFRGQEMHTKRWPQLQDEIAEAFRCMEEKKVLSSMRAAQFAGTAIEVKPNRIYNCAYVPADSIESIGELFYNLLCGSGVGFSVQSRHVSRLPPIYGTTDTEEVYAIEDTIEGWCDAVKHLLAAYMLRRAKPVFDYSRIRAEGSPLVTSGGRAPGPDPLRIALNRIENILQSAPSYLRTIDVYDICCHMADAVHAGGIRRAATIAFFDRWDTDMLYCKSGEWWVDNAQRGRSNNSAVFVRSEVTYGEYRDFLEVVKTNRTGEPAIFWTWDPDHLANPCVEIALPPFGFCNLSTVNGSNCISEEDFIYRVRMAARIGTYQAGWTEFDYLRPIWQETAEQEALLGVSITGIGAGVVQKFNLQKAAAAAVEENRRTAQLMGIRPAKRVTCLKPEGTGSLVLGTSQGIHAWEAEYYFKNLRLGKTEPIYSYLRTKMPDLVEDLEEKPETHAILRMPVQANPGGFIRSNETALDLLHRVKDFHHRWVRPGHREGINTHNISCTVTVRDHEWDDVDSWMWENRESYNGIATFPEYGGTHRQLPVVPCTKEEYEAALTHLRKIDLREVVETEDNTTLSHEVACAGGYCAI